MPRSVRRELLQFLGEIEPDDCPVAVEIELIERTPAPGTLSDCEPVIVLNWCDTLRRVET
jgi:hypothetical protein